MSDVIRKGLFGACKPIKNTVHEIDGIKRQKVIKTGERAERSLDHITMGAVFSCL